ncbi:MAG: sigma-54-dependent transcriptional regulator [Planctomycetota bacterium]
MILVIDDDHGFRSSLVDALTHWGHEVREADSLSSGRDVLEASAVDLVLLDNQLGDGLGVTLLPELLDDGGTTDVIMITAYPALQLAVDAMRKGVSDFIVKPFELSELRVVVERTLESRHLRRQVRHFRRVQRAEADELLGHSEAMCRMREHIDRIAGVNTPVLVIGETGTGKELVARAIHQRSPRHDNPMVTVNCSALPESLLESELFGHEAGAFTGAHHAYEGVFERAHGGTLFLDEIGEMKPELQARLLRVVEGQSFRRVGGKREISVDVRIIAATNRDLEDAIEEGRFRQDLYFRLSAFPIRTPPLREREGDIVLLAEAFVGQFSRSLGKSRLQFSPRATELLTQYSWRGNVRELRHIVERAAILCDGDTITQAELPPELSHPGIAIQAFAPTSGAVLPLAEIENIYIRLVLDHADGNVSEAARLLGITRNTIKSRLARERQTETDEQTGGDDDTATRNAS